MQKILLLHTGGTFGMEIDKAKNNSKAQDSYLHKLFEKVPEIKSLADISLKILCNIDSSDMDHTFLKKLARTIFKEWDNYDGFVVIHGTDTMAWSACAVAYFLQNISKPIVFTGSQRPLQALRSDARLNLIDSVELATHKIPEVMICLDSMVLRGTRATKFSSEKLEAFRSLNFPILGRFGVTLTKNESFFLETKKNQIFKPILNDKICSNIICLPCIPGARFSSSMIPSLLKETKGIVIQGLGAGNLPLNDEFWVQLCKEALKREIPLVMSSHCKEGYVNLSLYENGRHFSELGMISGYDMTLEALSLKLMVMIGRNVPFKNRFEFFKTPLAGEITSPR
jgi:L-asparaginase